MLQQVPYSAQKLAAPKQGQSSNAAFSVGNKTRSKQLKAHIARVACSAALNSKPSTTTATAETPARPRPQWQRTLAITGISLLAVVCGAVLSMFAIIVTYVVAKVIAELCLLIASGITVLDGMIRTEQESV